MTDCGPVVTGTQTVNDLRSGPAVRVPTWRKVCSGPGLTALVTLAAAILPAGVSVAQLYGMPGFDRASPDLSLIRRGIMVSTASLLCCAPLVMIAAWLYPLRSGQVTLALIIHTLLGLSCATGLTCLQPPEVIMGEFTFVDDPPTAGEGMAHGLFGASLPSADQLPAALAPNGPVTLSRQDMDFTVSSVTAFEPATMFISRFLSNGLRYATMAGCALGLSLYRENRKQSRRANRFQRRLAQLQLVTLRNQLRPHFLFNTLNGIATLMKRDAETAERMIHRLSDLLRASLASTDTEYVELQTEVSLVRHYLEIQQLRFGDRLKYTFDIPTRLRTMAVPSFCLQPLAENAVQHSLEKSGQVAIRVTAAQDTRGLLLEIADDGIGPDSHIRMGIGLGNTIQRLQELYGDDGDVEFYTPTEGGFAVRLWLPLTTLKPSSTDPQRTG